MGTFFVAVISIMLSVLAQIALKTGMSSADVKLALAAPFGMPTVLALFLNKFVVLGFSLYGLGAVVWLVVLSRWDVSKAYPLVGLGFVLTAALGWMLGEDVTALRMVGITLMCAGIVCVGLS
jgi:multidrug transporter EmrE-like cation transporter